MTKAPCAASVVLWCAVFSLLLLGSCVTRAATNSVRFDLGSFGATAVAYKPVRIKPTDASFPRVEGITVIGRDYGYRITGAGGVFTQSMVSGTYSITFTQQFSPTTFEITVPSTNFVGVLNASELTTSGTNAPGNLAAYSQVVADALFLRAFQISTSGVKLAAGFTNLNFAVGVTGYVSGSTAVLGVTASGSGSTTNATFWNTPIGGTTTFTNSGAASPQILFHNSNPNGIAFFDWKFGNATGGSGEPSWELVASSNLWYLLDPQDFYIPFVVNKSANTMTLSNSLIIPQGAGANKVLTSDANGAASWQVSTSGDAIPKLNGAGTNTTLYGDALVNSNLWFGIGSPFRAYAGTNDFVLSDNSGGIYDFLTYRKSTRHVTLGTIKYDFNLSVVTNLSTSYFDHFHPRAANSYDLGSFANSWRTQYVNAVIVYGAGNARISILDTNTGLAVTLQAAHGTIRSNLNRLVETNGSAGYTGAVVNVGQVYQGTNVQESWLGATATNRVLKMDGDWNFRLLPDDNSGSTNPLTLASASLYTSNSHRFGVTNIIVSSTNLVLLDVSAWHIFRLYLLTNAHVCFTNVTEGLLDSKVWFMQDSNGTRELISWKSATGLLQTNAGVTMGLTTNADRRDLLEISIGDAATNLACWWPKNFLPSTRFTNSLSSGGGGGGSLVVENTWKDRATTRSKAISASATPGNLLVVGIGVYGNDNTTHAVTDNIDGATGWVKIAGTDGNANRTCSIWYKKNVPAGITTVTVDAGVDGSSVNGIVHEVVGASTSAPFTSGEFIAASSSGQSSYGPGNVNNATADSILFGLYFAVDTGTATITLNDTGTTGAWSHNNANAVEQDCTVNSISMSMPHIITTTTGNKTHVWAGLDNSGYNSAIIAAFH